jgi:hypothetical protein
VTLVKAYHLNEPRARIDAVRAANNLQPFEYANAIAPGGLIRAIDVSQTQTALAQAFQAAMMPAPTFSTAPTIGGTIVVADIADLRVNVQMLEK